MIRIKWTLRNALVGITAALSSVSAVAQTDISGMWRNKNHMDNNYAEQPVDYLGIPLNADGRAKALSYDIAALSATERQCQMYTPYYTQTGPFGLRIWAEPDPVTQKLLAWKLGGWIDRDETTIWMDGRRHPSESALHSHGGFTTGVWEGNTVTARTTHFKLGDIKRHRGFSSDKATITHYIVRHGDILTVAAILEDPVYLAEPYVMSVPYKLDPNTNILPLTACEPIEELPHLHQTTGLVPHYLPEKNPFVNEVTELYGIPLEAVMGGPETMYPEFRKKIKDKYAPPPYCKAFCGGPPGAPPAPAAPPQRK